MYAHYLFLKILDMQSLNNIIIFIEFPWTAFQLYTPVGSVKAMNTQTFERSFSKSRQISLNAVARGLAPGEKRQVAL